MLRTLFDYQRFNKNAKLEARLNEVHDRYLSGGAALPDDALELAAAGEPQPPPNGPTLVGTSGKDDGRQTP